MGFSTTLGMYNLRKFLFDLSEQVSDKGIMHHHGAVMKAESSILKGFGPQVKELTLSKGGQVIFGMDATDDDGASAYGEDSNAAFADLKAAIYKQDLEGSIKAISELLK